MKRASDPVPAVGEHCEPYGWRQQGYPDRRTPDSSDATTRGFTLIELMVVMVILGILAALATASFMRAQDKAKEADVKVNMSAVQLGAEQYAADHLGNYPDGVTDSGFDWSKYIPQNPQNPFNLTESGSTMMESDVKTSMPAGAPVFTMAETYAGTGTVGRLRYFADTGNRSTYAIMGYDKEGQPIKRGTADTVNLVLHN